MNIRKLALEAIEKILNKAGYSNLVINEFFHKYEFKDEEKALFTKLVLGTVENKITLEYYLEPFLRKKQKPWINNLLLMSIYQIVFLSTPDYATVNEAVEIANMKDRSIGSFVNAVLRNFLRSELRSTSELNEIDSLSIKFSYPSWLVAYFLKDYPYDQVLRILQAYATPKKETIRVNTLKSTMDEVKDMLNKEGIEFEESPLVANGLLVDKPLVNHKLFLDGKITIQDIASQLASEVLDPQKDSIILDLCSAPGGKSSHLAALMNNTGEIYACDLHQHKINLMKRNFKRLGVTNVNLQLIDARNVKDFVKEEAFDYLLADLPCSGLGVLGHKVDLKYHITPDAITEIIELQKDILDSSAMLLKKGGYYVMSTCTINKLENEEQIANFLKNHPDYEKVKELTILPYEYNTDGFYICKMRRI